MKYLKSIKLFEANWYEVKEHLSVLSDLSLSLYDKDFNVKVSDEIISKENKRIVVDIVKNGSYRYGEMFSWYGLFTYLEIKEELLDMVRYMDEQGWEILNIELGITPIPDLYCKLDGDKLVSVSGEEIDYEIQQIIVKFIER